MPIAPRLLRTVITTATAAVLAATGCLATAVPAGATSATVVVGTQAELTAAVAAATPGQVIALRAGRYHGGVSITRSGTASAPITVRPYGDGPVTLSATLPVASCAATSPDPERTVRITRGASWWRLEGLTIEGGVYVIGTNSGAVKQWFGALIASGDWATRRSVPGRGVDDAVAAKGALADVSRRIGQPLVPSDGIALVGNTVTGKGIHSAMSRYGVISGNTVTDVACGTGPGIWLGNYSDGWLISANTVSRVAASTRSHHMQEGIRLGSASNYNTVTGNTVTDLPAGGRAFTTDQDSSYNVFSRNVAARVDQGFNEQMSGWGNTWSHNLATSYRVSGFTFRGKDTRLTTPSMDTSSYRTLVSCNSATGGTGPAMSAGALMASRFDGNVFGSVDLGRNLRTYWTAQGNTWDGSALAPAKSPGLLTATGC
jgi:hypothetical protein